MSATLEQQQAALHLANGVRMERAHLKRTIAAMGDKGGVAVAELIVRRDPRVASMPVRDLVVAIRFMGSEKLRRILRVTGIGDPNARCRDLTFRQRQELASELRLFGRRITSRRPERTARNPTRCGGCGVRLVEPTGICGFCAEQAA
jgi:hypothetical protein